MSPRPQPLPRPYARPEPRPGGRPAARSRPGPDDLRRTFEAVPPRTCDGDEPFADSWWGRAWVAALESLSMDEGRLFRGRTYADSGKVAAITVTPGRVVAYVHGSRPRPYRAELRLRSFTDTDWDIFLDAVAARPGHLAALLAKEMPHSLADTAAEAGIGLLPTAGDLDPGCSCPDHGWPCKHVAALCYQMARLLDADPFVLLLLRGRGERELLEELGRRNAAHSARERPAAPATPSVPAGEALADRYLPPLPAPLPVLPHPGQPPSYPSLPGARDPLALDHLATDAAARAHALLTTGLDPLAGLTAWQDAVRLAASRPTAGLTATTRALYRELAYATGRTPTDLARAVAAWRQGDAEGLAVLETPWDPPAGPFDRARPALAAADFPRFHPWRNHLTHPSGTLQLRFGHDGRWYGYESEPGEDDWWPRATPDSDPVGALMELGGG
ncbi:MULTISPECIES: SWIM zinc finger family protein [unclassified Streptomyces]|uniref:SWIM zinc finger family protein n=1 Tax=unclassified Streptomyces TaxID=2593676 RepID=UPI00225A706F|nr:MULTISPECIES: SWIM zinc finger family protein [unclassified Streptomyces]WSP54487.1 SWIM zinc finger family protein [Streptomyces sp. NBC_01241]WSU24836.1 SWIM zinc finger family protein [Streptomyces sp. NBC_01108]MCX4786024.1 SWIM zinc finger family protein [Streptomyces sp. NBC_01221]MCX4798119.1 SWIM zinc finger family protein [Streptomyces sp. NBC_01242]WSJ39370.1 SWIM zinc finger family protein [Streptomyces sp. NBC_01321]